jgi:hypothetical protein
MADCNILFSFGFGLSYTTFGYSDVAVANVSNAGNSDYESESWAAGVPTNNVTGSSTALWLHRPIFNITFSVENTGADAGTEIPQLYIHHPPSANEPPSLLKGFTDIYLKAGESKTVALTLSRFDLSVWDVVQQGWVKPDGEITFTVGASSRDGRVNGTLPL